MFTSLKQIQNRILFFYENNSAIIFKRNAFKTVKRPDLSALKNPVAHKVDIPTQIANKIKLQGPITVADYMNLTLIHNESGYYMNRNALGREGDFITSPEVTQLFGEMIGIWFIAEWQKLGMPKPLQIIEFGPGNGTLIGDILKVISKVGIEHDSLSIHLIELSPLFQRLQANKLCMTYKLSDSTPHYCEGETVRGSKIFWYKELKNIPKGFSWIVANEFFDVLPIHKFQKTKDGWREILIDLDSSTSTDVPKFRYVVSKKDTTATKMYSSLANEYKDLDHFEVCPQGLVLAKELSTRINENGGIGLLIDYGQDSAKGDTFRAFKKHKQVDPLECPGSADLTADVDFSLLKKSAENARVFGPVSQGSFLLTSRIDLRLEVLLENATNDQKDVLKQSYHMLIDNNKMGDCFKVMGIFPMITDAHYERFPVLGFPK